jgi:hypothetical protein
VLVLALWVGLVVFASVGEVVLRACGVPSSTRLKGSPMTHPPPCDLELPDAEPVYSCGMTQRQHKTPSVWPTLRSNGAPTLGLECRTCEACGSTFAVEVEG